jgi:hypothetical protein
MEYQNRSLILEVFKMEKLIDYRIRTALHDFADENAR